jgi:beta-phosphoglucomutase
MNAIRALLVDLDGTLVATKAANARAYADALEEIGIPCNAAQQDLIASGRNWREFLPLLMPGSSEGERASLAARKSVLYSGRVAETVVNAALVALIRDSRSLRKTALVTTASMESVRAILAHHGLTDLFDTVVTGNDVSRHKPDPEAYILAAARLQVTPNECLVFEDSDVGMAAAAAFGALALRVAI